jgi:hypothetical protein
MRKRVRAIAATVLVLASASVIMAQQPPGRGAGAAPPTPQQAAAIDLTGYWVSVIVEDWKWRMVTPKKGVYEAIPLNDAGRKAGDTWDPARDEAAGEQCRAYGAANIMRMPGRLHITWENASTLRVDTDAGTQTRRFYFGASPPAGEPSWQGSSVARWELGPGRGRGTARGGSLKVVTTNLKPGYVRKNGAPYSANARVTEYYDINTLPSGDQWLTVTTNVEDQQFFVRHYLTTSDFMKQANATGWNPTPCSSR